ncbi:hypothetical protein PR048_024261 [Dryococelus australis]|uniref:Uncharacterized protein n=1 Tax=Dryococelus australis TaxID=614101 RepID=A0ABQ9GN46_9NEOP|nr:hypothetical protein PR048_024261 [Dryococelus australis]
MIYKLYWSSILNTNLYLWLKYRREEDDQIFQKRDFIEKLNMCDNTFSPCMHIDDLQHQMRGIFPHYVDLCHICSTVCQKTACMCWHCS